MQTNKNELLKMLKDLRSFIAENNDWCDVEKDKIDDITNFIIKNL